MHVKLARETYCDTQIAALVILAAHRAGCFIVAVTAMEDFLMLILRWMSGQT